MTALAANDNALKTAPRGRLSVIVTNAATVYAGGGIGLTTAGRASPWSDTAGLEWLGVAMPSTARNLPAYAGGKVVGDTSYSPPHEVDIDVTGPKLIGVPVTGASAQANVGDRVYSASDNLSTDLTLTPTTNVKAIGRITRFRSATSFDVQLFTPWEYANQGTVSDITALTDSSGGAATDGTIGAVTAPTALGATLTDNTGQSGTHDDTLAATTVPAALTGGESPTEAEHNAVLTLLGVMVQNQSDVAQKVIELVTAQGQDRTAIVALTDAVAELAAKVNEVIADANLGN